MHALDGYLSGVLSYSYFEQPGPISVGFTCGSITFNLGYTVEPLLSGHNYMY